jgi:AcrR family transcriptional regulator
MGRREEILDSALEQFNKYGIAKLTLEDIARALGLKKTAIYYYFKNKDDLLKEMIERIIENVKDEVTETVDKADGVKNKLRAFMLCKVSIMRKNGNLWELFDKDYLPKRAKDFLMLKKGCIAEFDFSTIYKIIDDGIKENKIEYRINDSLVLMIMGVVYGIFIGNFVINVNWNEESLIENSLKVIFKGIGFDEE